MEKTNRKKKRKRKRSGLEKVVMCLLSTVLIIVLVLGLAGTILYKSGEIALQQNPKWSSTLRRSLRSGRR